MLNRTNVFNLMVVALLVLTLAPQPLRALSGFEATDNTLERLNDSATRSRLALQATGPSEVLMRDKQFPRRVIQSHPVPRAIADADETIARTAEEGTTWHIETVDSAGDVGMWTSLAMDGNGYPHVSYHDWSNGELKYAYQDVSNWYIQTVDSEGDVGEYTSLALDGSDYPHISYFDNTNGNLKYAYQDSSGWHIRMVNNEDVGEYTSLALDGNGYPHISYTSYTSRANLKYAYQDASGWHIQTVDSLEEGEGVIWQISLALDESNYPHMSYYYWGKSDLKYAYQDASGWHIRTIDTGLGIGQWVGYSSLELDGSGYPHIGYYDKTNVDLKYAYWDGSGWHIQTVDSEGHVGMYTSLALDRSSYPHIGYYDETNNDLKYAYQNSSGWHTQAVDTGLAPFSGYISLALDGIGYPHISYLDRTNNDLKFAQTGPKPPPAPEVGEPWVERVRPCFTGPFYIKGPRLPNRYDAFVDWQGLTPGLVDFALNGNHDLETSSSNPVSHVYDMGSDLDYSLFGTRNKLRVSAVAENGEASEPYYLYPIGVWAPDWLPGQPAVFNPGCLEGEVKYQWGRSFPEPPFETEVTPPPWFPFIGSDPFGVKETQAALDISGSSNGSGSAKLSGQTGFAVSGQTVGGSVYGQGNAGIREGKGLQLTQAIFGLELWGKVEASRPLVDVICKAFTGGACPLKEAESIPVVGGIIRWFNEKAELKGEIEPALNAEAVFKSTSSDWKWVSIRGGAQVRMTLSLILDIIKKGLSATAYGGGEPSIQLQVPPDPSYLKEVAAELFAGVKIKVWRFEDKYEASYEWSYSPNTTSLTAASPAGIRTLTTTGWYPIPRDYAVNRRTYAIFRANESPLHLGETEAQQSAAPTAIYATEENLIASNIFPESHPAIAADGETMLLWVHDDTTKPLMQGEEIRYTVYDGTSWSSPAGVSDDHLQDFAPQVAYDSSGQAVAAWERNKLTQTEDSDFGAAYANAFEIAYAVWDGSVWTSPTYLTDNEALDHAPTLAAGNDGDLFLVWRHNTAGELMGSITDTDTISYTVWNGSSWSAPQTLLEDIHGITTLSTARHDGNKMAVVYSRDTDGDLSTSSDQELFQMTWDGTSWSMSVQLTDDDQPDDSPTLFYDTSGNPRLLWLKGDTLYALLGDLSSTPQAIAVEGSAAVLDYAAAQDDNGNLILLWQSYSEEGVDVFYAAYDQQHDVFSLVEQLTHDEPLEKFMVPTFAPSGEMLMAYGKDELITTTVEVSPTLTISNVTTFGQSDLYVLRHTFGPDLVLEAQDLAVDPINPVSGSMAHISATLHNVGDRAVVDPEVAFYQGNPDSEGTLIYTSTDSLTLAGGMTTTVGADWTVPSSGGPFAIYAVADPSGSVSELNEENNQAYRQAVMPDLMMDNVWVDYGRGQNITLTVAISNTGVVAAPGMTVTFRLDNPITGTEVAQTTTGSLDAGAEVETRVVWDASAISTGRYKIHAVIDPDKAITEANEENNSGWAGVAILPDLALRSTAVVTGIDADGMQSASIWVFNEGQRDASGVQLGLYSRIPVSGTVPLMSTMMDIPAGEYRVANFNLGTYIWGFYGGVGVNGEVEDRDTSNNVLQMGNVLRFVYLPLILCDQ